MQARKGNKVYQIYDEISADAYAANGYDIYDNGKLIRHAVGKTVPIAKYEEALARIAELEAQTSKTKAELLAEAEERGIEVPKRATKAELEELLGA